MFKLIEYGKDDERMYLALIVLRLDEMRLHSRALIGVEITSGEALEGRGATGLDELDKENRRKR